MLVGSASRNGIQLVSAVLDTPSEDARDTDTLALFRWAFPRFQRIRAVIKGHRAAMAPDPFPRRRRAQARGRTDRAADRGLRGHRADGQASPSSRPSPSPGPIHRGQRLGRVEVSQRGKARRHGAADRGGDRVPAAGIAQRTKTWATRPLFLLGGRRGGAGRYGAARDAAAASPARRPSETRAA